MVFIIVRKAMKGTLFLPLSLRTTAHTLEHFPLDFDLALELVHLSRW